MSFTEFLIKSLDHHSERINEKCRSELENYCENLAGSGYPRLGECKVNLEELVSSKKTGESEYAAIVEGTYSVTCTDPVDKDEHSLGSESFIAKIIFRHPGGKNYLEIEDIKIEINELFEDE